MQSRRQSYLLRSMKIKCIMLIMYPLSSYRRVALNLTEFYAFGVLYFTVNGSERRVHWMNKVIGI